MKGSTLLCQRQLLGHAPDILRMGPGRALGPDFSYATAQTAFRGQTEAGRTEHMIVYTDGTPNGDAAAQAVLRTAEADYQAVTNWFGGISLPPGQEGDDQTTPRTATPVQVLIDQQAGGAYHFGCDATDIYIEPTPELANGFMVAELVEIFEPAINNGWSCGNTNGEGLSRVLAGERNANLGPLFTQTGSGMVAGWTRRLRQLERRRRPRREQQRLRDALPLLPAQPARRQLGEDRRHRRRDARRDVPAADR